MDKNKEEYILRLLESLKEPLFTVDEEEGDVRIASKDTMSSESVLRLISIGGLRRITTERGCIAFYFATDKIHIPDTSIHFERHSTRTEEGRILKRSIEELSGERLSSSPLLYQVGSKRVWVILLGEELIMWPDVPE